MFYCKVIWPQNFAVTDRLAIIEEGVRLADAKRVIKVTELERDRDRDETLASPTQSDQSRVRLI